MNHETVSPRPNDIDRLLCASGTAAEQPAPFSQAELDALPAVPAGTELTEHEVYIDLNHLANGAFRALAGQTSGSGNRHVAERDLDPASWDLLCRAAAAAALPTGEIEPAMPDASDSNALASPLSEM